MLTAEREAPRGVVAGVARPPSSASTAALAAAVVGFFVVTFDTVVVNVALPSIRRDLGAGITGLQWVVDGYTLMFAGLLLWSGALSDRIGARRGFSTGVELFIAASAACGFAPSLATLVAARFVQGSAAAVMMPASMALIGHAFADPRRRAHAIAVWAMGGALASSSGPVFGGALTLISWRLIFFINVPVGAAALALLSRLAPSPQRRMPLDWVGQLTAVLAMGGLTYGAIEPAPPGSRRRASSPRSPLPPSPAPHSSSPRTGKCTQWCRCRYSGRATCRSPWSSASRSWLATTGCRS
jgi:MFS family permease